MSSATADTPHDAAGPAAPSPLAAGGCTDLLLQARRIAAWLQEADHCVVVAGAELGTLDAERSASPRRARDGLVPGAASEFMWPMPTHMGLVACLREGLVHHVVACTIDGTLRRAGIPSAALTELRGNATLEYCKRCHAEYVRDFLCRTAVGTTDHRTGRVCRRRTPAGDVCNGKLMDNIADAGEPIPRKTLKVALETVRTSDLCVLLGGDLPLDLVQAAARPDSRLVVCGGCPPPPVLDRAAAALCVCADTDALMRVLLPELGIEPPAFTLVRQVMVSHAMRRRATDGPSSRSGTEMGAGCRGGGAGGGTSGASAARAAADAGHATAATDDAARGVADALAVESMEPDGTPTHLLRSVALGGAALSQEPFLFRGGFTGDHELTLHFKGWGPGREPPPPLVLRHRVPAQGQSTMYRLEFSTATLTWSLEEPWECGLTSTAVLLTARALGGAAPEADGDGVRAGLLDELQTLSLEECQRRYSVTIETTHHFPPGADLGPAAHATGCGPASSPAGAVAVGLCLTPTDPEGYRLIESVGYRLPAGEREVTEPPFRTVVPCAELPEAAAVPVVLNLRAGSCKEYLHPVARAESHRYALALLTKGQKKKIRMSTGPA